MTDYRLPTDEDSAARLANFKQFIRGDLVCRGCHAHPTDNTEWCPTCHERYDEYPDAPYAWFHCTEIRYTLKVGSFERLAVIADSYNQIAEIRHEWTEHDDRGEATTYRRRIYDRLSTPPDHVKDMLPWLQSEIDDLRKHSS